MLGFRETMAMVVMLAATLQNKLNIYNLKGGRFTTVRW